MPGVIKVPTDPKNFLKLLKDQLEIAQSLPRSRETDLRIDLIKKLIGEIQEASETPMSQLLETLLQQIGRLEGGSR